MMGFAACGDGDEPNQDRDAGTDSGLAFVKGTPLVVVPSDDVDPDSEGLQIDVSVEPTAKNTDGYGPVTFTLNQEKQGAPVPWSEGVASVRLTLEVGEPKTKTLNFVSARATREGESEANVAWVFTVNAK